MAAIAGALIASAPAVAAGAVPASKWYWTLVVPGSSPNTLVLATSGGLYRSQNGGVSWQPSGLAGVDATSLAQSGSTLYAAGVRTSTAATPVVVVHGDYYVASGRPVFAESTDDGASWKDVDPRGLPATGIQALAVDPADAEVVYAVLRTGALYRSTDGARAFALVTPSVGGTPWALVVAGGGRLVAGDMTTGAYVSANATTWQRTSFVDPDGGRMVMEYAVQPNDPEHVLMTSYGVEASTDSGATWHVVLKSKVMFGPVAWAADSRVAYAVGFDGSLWRSNDGGASWSEVG